MIYSHEKNQSKSSHKQNKICIMVAIITVTNSLIQKHCHKCRRKRPIRRKTKLTKQMTTIKSFYRRNCGLISNAYNQLERYTSMQFRSCEKTVSRIFFLRLGDDLICLSDVECCNFKPDKGVIYDPFVWNGHT